MELYVKASDGKDVRISTRPVPYCGMEYGSPIPMMDRDESRAGTTIEAMGFRLSYDSLGYCYSRVRMDV